MLKILENINVNSTATKISKPKEHLLLHQNQSFKKNLKDTSRRWFTFSER